MSNSDSIHTGTFHALNASPVEEVIQADDEVFDVAEDEVIDGAVATPLLPRRPGAATLQSSVAAAPSSATSTTNSAPPSGSFFPTSENKNQPHKTRNRYKNLNDQDGVTEALLAARQAENDSKALVDRKMESKLAAEERKVETETGLVEMQLREAKQEAILAVLRRRKQATEDFKLSEERAEQLFPFPT